MISGIMSMPCTKISKPKVKRAMGSITSMPTVAIMMPRTVATVPLANDLRCAMTMTIRANRISENLPGVRIRSATLTASGATNISSRAPIAPPTIEPSAAWPSALAPNPFFISALPSMEVIMLAGAPGMLMVVAVMLPAYIPAMKMAAHMTRATTTSRL